MVWGLGVRVDAGSEEDDDGDSVGLVESESARMFLYTTSSELELSAFWYTSPQSDAAEAIFHPFALITG